MLKKLVDWLAQEESKQPQQPSLELAAGVLLVEVMRADHEFDNNEEALVKASLIELFNYSQEQAQELLEESREISNKASDYYKYTQQIHAHFDAKKKFTLLRMLWKIAFADDEVKGIEEHSIRRIAELLYVPHSEFIRAKVSARNNL